MCGLVGVVAKDPRGLYTSHGEIFKETLIANSVRGLDSTGVFGVSLRNEVVMLKQAVDPHIFLKTPQYQKWNARVHEYRLIVGHNRKATTGAITSKNAHPFLEKDITLVHNGVVYDHKKLNTEVDVDSHALCHSFATKGAIETIKDVRGAFALVWYNAKEKALYFWRNDQRPLAFCERDQDIWFASEGAMLQWILNRDNRGNTMAKKEFRILPENTLVKMTFDPFKIEEQSLSEKPLIASNYGNWDNVRKTNFMEDCYPTVVKPIAYSLVDEDDLELNALEQFMREQGRAKLKASNLETSLSAKEVLKIYPFESDILFRVGTIEKFMEKRFVIDGQVYLPGGPVVPAKFFTEDGFNVKQFEAWKRAGTIEAKVQMVTQKDDKVTIHVKDCVLPDSVATFNHTTYPRLEWNLLIKELKCHNCSRKLNLTKPELTSINQLNNQVGRYKIHCSDCVIAHVPEDKRDALIKSSGTSIQNRKSVS